MTKSVKRLIEGFQPEHYDVHIVPSADKKHFRGSVSIKGKKVGRPSQRLTFHQNGLTITNAQVVKYDKKGEQQITINRINNQNTLQEVRLHADSMLYPGDYLVTMEFKGKITPGMTGIYPCPFVHEDKEKSLLMTQFESHFAREGFPCIDEPAAKATFDLAITAPSHETVIANTLPKSETDNGDGTKTIAFETTPKMSTYLLAFVMGEIHNKAGRTKNGLDVKVWGTVAQPAESFDFALDAAVKIAEWFEDYFKIPYPLPKLDHIAVPDFSAGAMENWGLLTYREAVLLLYPEAASQSTKETIAEVVAHETSHQWFGNLVTMEWWDDLWLNESFANMMEYAPLAELWPDWHPWDTFVVSEGLSAFRRDSTPGVQPVKIPVHHPDEISTIFDPSIVYAKGGRLLYMLKNYIGDEAFRKGLQRYFKKHAYKNTRGADLWAALSEASGKDIGAFMNPWLERSGFPVVSIDQHGNSLRLTQQHFLDNLDMIDKDRVWPVPLFIDLPGAPEVLDSATQAHELTSDDFVVVNQGSRGHYITQYKNPAHKQALIDMVRSQKLGVIDRLMLLNNGTMLSRAGLESLKDTLELIEAYKDESSEPVWDIMSLVYADARRFIDLDESIEPVMKAQIRELIAKQYKRLGWEESPDDSPADQKLRGTILGLGAYAEDPAIIKQSLAYFDQYKTDPSVVSGELVGIIFGVAVKLQHPGAFEYLLELYQKTTNSDLKRDISGGLTATRDPHEAAKLLELAKNPKVFKPQDADRLIFMLLRNRYTKLQAWQWMEDNWDWVEQTYAQDKSYDYWPRFAAAVSNTPELQKRFETFFMPKRDNLVLRRNIDIGIEEIKSRLAWLERDLPNIQAFFKQ